MLNNTADYKAKWARLRMFNAGFFEEGLLKIAMAALFAGPHATLVGSGAVLCGNLTCPLWIGCHSYRRIM